MASVKLNLNLLQCHPFRGHGVKCTPLLVVMRCFKGSARDARKRKWSKMAAVKRRTPKTFDYEQFMSKNYEKELFAFAHRLSLNPDNALLRTALTHKSFTDNTETDLILEHNGKLAVLGFNVTTQFISEFLFLSYVNIPTFGLRSLLDYLVSRTVLVKVARSLSIPELIKTPGSAPARAFIQDFIIVELYGKELQSIIKFKNPEVSLAALLIQQKKEEPVARVITRSEKHTDCPVYVVGIFSSQTLLAKGFLYPDLLHLATSSILEKAKQEAYSAALTKLLQLNVPPTPGFPADKDI